MNINKLAMKYEALKRKMKNHSYLSFFDNRALNIEYCRGVVKFDDNVIVLELARSFIKIVGLDLTMKNYAYDCIKIYGNIHSITFEDKNRQIGRDKA